MLIFPDQRLTFLATPKTGTTAIEMALQPHAEIIFAKQRKHINAKRYAGKIAPFLKRTFGIETETVAVMREPVEQIRSWYRYRARAEVAGLPRATSTMTFDDFVMAVISNRPPEFARIGSQHGFLTDRAGALKVDHLFAYEDQARLLAFLSDRLDTRVKLEQRNVSPKVEAPLSAHVEALLRAKRAAEFALYERLMSADGYLRSA